MPKTSQLLTSPLAGTAVAPIYDYTEDQQVKIKALREVRNIALETARTAFMTLEPQHAATLQLPEDDPYYPWELRFLNKPDTMPRYMRAAKWYIAPTCPKIRRCSMLTPIPGNSKTRRNGSRKR